MGSQSSNVISAGALRVGFVSNRPETKSIVDKLVSSMTPRRYDSRGNREIAAPAEHLMQHVSNRTAEHISDSTSLLQVLPDLKMVQQILVSSIISPNDMVSTELNISVDNIDLDGELVASGLKIVKDFLDKTYKIEQKMHEILNCMLFEEGSYPLAILPETAIDNVINDPYRVSMESLRDIAFNADGQIKNIGILGPSTLRIAEDMMPSMESNGRYSESDRLIMRNLGLEGMTIDVTKNYDGIMVKVDGKSVLNTTDNIDALKFPMLRKKMASDKADELLHRNNTDGNDLKKISAAQLEAGLYKNRQYAWSPIVPIKTMKDLDKPTVGHPLVMRLPAESIIPVHVPGNVRDHIGYFVMLDKTGNPVSKVQMFDYYNDLSTNVSQAREMVTQMISTVKRFSVGDQSLDKMDIDGLTYTYMQLIENDLLDRLKNGVYGEEVQISKPTEIYQIMMSRALARMQTQLLYIPKSLMTYMAFDYNGFGVGKSLVEDTRILGGMRAMLLFADTMAKIKNSIGRTKVKIELDPEDADPSRTVEFLLHEYAKNRQATYPLGASNPLDLVNFLQNAGIEVEVSGHEGYPVTQFSTEDYHSDKTTVDADLQTELRKRHMAAFGVPPELVDGANEVAFATTLVSQNLLLSKRVMIYQEAFTAFLEDHIRKFIYNSQILMDALREAFKLLKSKIVGPYAEACARDGSYDVLIMLFLKALRFKLPMPNTVKLEAQLAAYKVYSDGLEEVLKAYISPDFLTNTELGQLAGSIPATVAAIKAYFQREWLRDNNVMPELNDLVARDKNDKSTFNLLEKNEEHIKNIADAVMGMMRKVAPEIKKNDKTLTDIGAPTGGASGGDQFGGGGFGGDMGGGDMGGGDLGGDLGMGEPGAVPAGGEQGAGELGGLGEPGELPEAPAEAPVGGELNEAGSPEEPGSPTGKNPGTGKPVKKKPGETEEEDELGPR